MVLVPVPIILAVVYLLRGNGDAFRGLMGDATATTTAEEELYDFFCLGLPQLSSILEFVLVIDTCRDADADIAVAVAIVLFGGEGVARTISICSP